MGLSRKLPVLLVGCLLLLSSWAGGGDILRGGTRIGSQPDDGRAAAASGAAEAARLSQNASDSLARTTRAIQEVNAMQSAARAAAARASATTGADPLQPSVRLPLVADGLAPGGLVVAPGAGPGSALWQGASLPTQRSGKGGGKIVTVKQNQSQALLTWENFNIGKSTTLRFNQKAGGEDVGKWVAFNTVKDPAGRPSQILGSIKADGQVYVINANGIIFGGTSQVNARGFVASTLPVNTNLLERGLLNQEEGAAQFLFSSTQQGAFIPEQPSNITGRFGDVIVQAGAQLKSPSLPGGGGGRVALIGANVKNDGTISTPGGQTILAAGLQVGWEPHPSSDPSLRGLDVFVGHVGDYSGTVVNNGLIKVPTGNATIVGKELRMNGAIDSRTTVSLNGRVDILANYDAVPNKEYTPSNSAAQPPFINRETGQVRFCSGSVVRILPAYESSKTTVGTRLPLESIINIQGSDVYFGRKSSVFAPGAKVKIDAGRWAPATGVETGGVAQFSRVPPDFIYTRGQVYLDRSARIDVSGSTDVCVPLSHSILTVQLRGNELAVAPLQREGPLRGVDLVIDLRRSGVYNGRAWTGTPLGDANGFANIIERNASQLSATGGDIMIQAGQAFIARKGSVLNVSGGYFRHEAGVVKTTRLITNGRLVDIASATPDQSYEGIYTPLFTRTASRWGISETFLSPLAPTGAHLQPEYLAEADGGNIQITAPSMAMDGEMLGRTLKGLRQTRPGADVAELAALASLTLRFKGQINSSDPNVVFPYVSPTPPKIVFGMRGRQDSPGKFRPDALQPLKPGRLAKVRLSKDFFQLTGFGHVEMENSDGAVVFKRGSAMVLPGTGSLTVSARNVRIRSNIQAPGGDLSFTAYNYSPYQAAILLAVDQALEPALRPKLGSVIVASGVTLSTAGRLVDDRPQAHATPYQALTTAGGSVSLVGYNVRLSAGSLVDVSGGAYVSPRGAVRYGDAGAIEIRAGVDPFLRARLGGKLRLNGGLAGYSGAEGGTLSIAAPIIQVGGRRLHREALVLQPDIFNQGGFTRFELTGVGVMPKTFEVTTEIAAASYLPSVFIAPGTILRPRVESLVYAPFGGARVGAGFRRMVLPDGMRRPVSLAFAAPGVKRDFRVLENNITAGDLLVRGDIVLGKRARIETDPLASVSFTGQTVTMLGSVIAPGGSIQITGANSFPIPQPESASFPFARPTVFIGPKAVLSTAGTMVPTPDAYGRTLGTVLPGGSITVRGNIVAARGAVMDVSGASAMLDFHPAALGLGMQTSVPVTSGINSPLFQLLTVPYRVDSNGGTLTLAGSQMLFSDARLVGNSGGPTALGGTLSISSGRFYLPGESQFGDDTNLLVSQSGSQIAKINRAPGIGVPVLAADGSRAAAMGYFSVDRFKKGGFDSLDLGMLTPPVGVASGGIVEFAENVRIHARGFLRVAAGGVIKTQGNVLLRAPYVAVGQIFRPPSHPDETFNLFRKIVPGDTDNNYTFAPTHGTGSLTVKARLLDIGTLTLDGIGLTRFFAGSGDIRGNGTLSVAGNLLMSAGQIYPPTLTTFNVFVYDAPEATGSATFRRNGTAATPWSAGGTLNVYASTIRQHGVLRAPLGAITLGWDGSVYAPVNPAVGLGAPKTTLLDLGARSITSVAGLAASTGAPLLIPFGLSPDGFTWIDPRGVNVTITGLPSKRIQLAGESIHARRGSVIDLRGGGDLAAYRWISGLGGSVDLLGTGTREWDAQSQYEAGDLVLFRGRTWSARVSIDPSEYQPTGAPVPRASRFWIQVPESYAIVPGFRGMFAPYAPFNTSSQASALGGDPGYVSAGLRLGDQIHLDGFRGGGNYTLLPRRYATLPGALLVTPQITPQMTGPLGIFENEEGAHFVTGYRFNALHRAPRQSQVRSLYEIVAGDVLAGRAEYAIYNANSFMREAAKRLDVSNVQRLPIDGGHGVIHANESMVLANDILGAVGNGGRGSSLDLSSFRDIFITDSGSPAGSALVLSARNLSRFRVGSLLIGGIRTFLPSGASVDVRTTNVTLANRKAVLTGPEVTLVAREQLVLAPGSVLRSRGNASGRAERFLLSGPGALARVSWDERATIQRTGSLDATAPLIRIGAGANISGNAVLFDSTHAFDLSSDARFRAQALTMNAGQISFGLGGSSSLSGSLISPHLVLSGSVLRDVQQVSSLSLQAYQHSIDIYGAGIFGSSSLERLSLSTSQLRGFHMAGGQAVFNVKNLSLQNPLSTVAPGVVAASSGELIFNTATTEIGAGRVDVSQFDATTISASSGMRFLGVGGLFIAGNAMVRTPVVVTSRGADHELNATGSLQLVGGGISRTVPALGGKLKLRGADIFSSTQLLLPSGLLDIQAASGDIRIAGVVDVAGVGVRFHDVVRHTDGGVILLEAATGNVQLLGTSVVRVGADGGNAGSLEVRVPQGEFTAQGAIDASGRTGGLFLLDTQALASYGQLNALLARSGFNERRDLRVRTGAVTIDGITNTRLFTLIADAGDILVSGVIDASGRTGGSITLAGSGNLTIENGARLTVRGEQFNAAGKGGSIRLEAGAAINGLVINPGAMVTLQSGAVVDLSVDALVPGSYNTPFSSAFYGRYEGTLHLRAPRNATNSDLGIAPIAASILGGSHIVAEGYEVYDLTASGGIITGWRTAIAALPAAGTTQRTVYNRAADFLSVANHDAMVARLLGADLQGLAGRLVILPGAELINRLGNLTLGHPTATSLGSAAATNNSADWNLSDFRFGPQRAPGMLTLRAAGNVVFNNALSDGFNPFTASATNGNSMLWMGQLQNLETARPDTIQSWSYQITAGADFAGADIRAVRPLSALAVGSGSVLVGQFYDAVPNFSGSAPGTGTNGLTANHLRISTTSADQGTRYEVIRTGTGTISVNAARDVQLRNHFASIYTAGVRIPNPQTIFNTDDFRPPTFFFSGATHPDQSPLGAPQQYYGPPQVDEDGLNRRIPQWSIAGGDLRISAGQDIARYHGVDGSGAFILATSRQIPGNWLYRAGVIDAATGTFGLVTESDLVNPSVSTTWWVDFSNFFQSFGALGGGNISLFAGRDVLNADAAIPTNARMAGRSATGNLAPSLDRMLELGGGDLSVTSRRDLSGGNYYVERGLGSLRSGGSITTNAARSPSLGRLAGDPAQVFDSLTWLPTTLFLGRGGFDVSARGDVLLGPVANAFLLPAGVNNKAWYRTYFSTYGEDAFVNTASIGGSVTHRLAATLPGGNIARPILEVWLDTQNVFREGASNNRASFYQPWIRLNESSVSSLLTSLTLLPAHIHSTAFGGDINVVGSMNLMPARSGNLGLYASGAIPGLQPVGIGLTLSGQSATAFVSSRINISDADPAAINSILRPTGILPTSNEFLARLFRETGSYTGVNAGVDVKRSLHAPFGLHGQDMEPVRLYAAGGDISGLTLFSPKFTRVIAERDITDVAFYLQNARPDTLSLVSAGRDIVPYNENAALRSLAGDLSQGNFIVDIPQTTTLQQGGVAVTTTALAGDVQIGGGGSLHLLAGRNIDLGSGPNLTDGRGVGVTSIGRLRNPFLPFDGANMLLMAGVGGKQGGPATSLAQSALDFDGFIAEYVKGGVPAGMEEYASEWQRFDRLTRERQAELALKLFFILLRNSGAEAAETGLYTSGFSAIESLFGSSASAGELFTRSRDIRSATGGSITVATPGGGITMASDIFGNPLIPPGIVTEFGGGVSIFSKGSLDIGRARVFTLRGGDVTIWSSEGDIAAGTAPKTVVTAPPTRVSVDATSAEVLTDLGGLATGGGIGVLAAVEGVEPGNVTLIAPSGVVDAGDAGIRATGSVTIAAVTVLNANNIAAAGGSTGVPSTPTVAAPNLGSLSAASNTAGAAASSAQSATRQAGPETSQQVVETPSIITVEVLGYGGPGSDKEEEEQEKEQ